MSMEVIEKATRSSRDIILDAAHKVVRQRGASHLTIDAVAEASGLSKGGVLYNFPSKKKLLEGLLDRAAADRSKQVAEARREICGPNRTLRATLDSKPTEAERGPLIQAFLAATAEDPAFADRLPPVLRDQAEQIAAEAEDPEGALIVWLANAGLHLLEILRLHRFEDEMRERIELRLSEMALE